MAADETAPGRRGGVGRGAARGGGALLAVGTIVALIARLVMLAATIVALIIVAAILFKVLDANASNSIVSNVTDVAKSLVGPFDNIFKPKDPKVAIAVNWGLAAFVYLVVGAIIASVIRRLAPTPREV